MGLPEREPPRGNAAENRCGRRPRPRRLHLRLVFLRRSPDAGQQIPQLGAGRRIPESSEQRPDEILAIVVQPRSGRHSPGSRDNRDVRTADRLCDRALLQASVVLARRRMPLLLDLRGEYVPRYVRRRLRRAGEAIARFREKVKAAGFPDLHLNGVLFGLGGILSQAVAALGLNSTTRTSGFITTFCPTFRPPATKRPRANT